MDAIETTSLLPKNKGNLTILDCPAYHASSNGNFTGLTVTEILESATDPFWRGIRWLLFVSFWFAMVAMLVGAALNINEASKTCGLTDEMLNLTVIPLEVPTAFVSEFATPSIIKDQEIMVMVN